jgi:hypothetical protein
MNQAKFDVGDPVKITAGTYKDAEGVVEDLLPECDAVRVHTKDGAVYGFLEGMVRIQKPRPMNSKPVRSPIRK